MATWMERREIEKQEIEKQEMLDQAAAETWVAKRTIFVGGTRNSDEDQLKRSFRRFGLVSSVDVELDCRGASRGWGYVTFVQPSMAERCLQDGGHHILLNGVKVQARACRMPKRLSSQHLLYPRVEKAKISLLNAKMEKLELEARLSGENKPKSGTSSAASSPRSSPTQDSPVRTVCFGTLSVSRVPDSQLQQSKRKDSSEDECQICFDKKVDCAFYTCGHTCFCYGCAMSCKRASPPLCPLCRAKITDVLKLYRS